MDSAPGRPSMGLGSMIDFVVSTSDRKHQIKDPPEHLSLEVFQAHPAGRKLQGRPRISRDCHLIWVGERFRDSQEKLESRKRDIWTTFCLTCCHDNLTPDKRQKMD